MKLIIYSNGQIQTIDNIGGVKAYSAKEVTVVKTDTYHRTETILDGRAFVIATDSDACLALAGTGVDTSPLHGFMLNEYL